MSLKLSSHLLFKFILLLAIGVMVLLPASPAILKLPDRDSGVFAYIGREIAEGGAPYLDAWDHKPPLIYLANAVFLKVYDSYWAVWAMQLVLLVVTTWAIYWMLSKLIERKWALLTLSLWLLGYAICLDGGNSTEQLGITWQVLFLFSLLHHILKSNWRWVFLAGVAAALLFFTKPNLIALPLAWGLVQLLKAWRIKRIDMSDTAFTAGALLTAAVILSWLALQGALPAFWDQAIRYNFLYAGSASWLDRFNTLLFGFWQLLPSTLPILGALGAWQLLRKRTDANSTFWQILLISLPLEVGLAILGGNQYPHYFLPLITCLALLSIQSRAVIESIGIRLRFLSSNVITLLIFVTACVWIAVAGSSITRLVSAPLPKEPGVVLLQQLANQGRVLVWGNEVELLFAAKLKSFDKYIYIYPLFNQAYMSEEASRTWLDSLLANLPEVIVDASFNNEKVPPLVPGSNHWLVNEMVAILDNHYVRQEQEIRGRWAVWKLAR